MTSQQPGSWLTTQDHFPPWKEQRSVLTVLVKHLPFLHAILLTKPSSVDLQNSLSTLKVFHTVLLLNKELMSQSEKCDSVFNIMESVDVTFPTILKHLS